MRNLLMTIGLVLVLSFTGCSNKESDVKESISTAGTIAIANMDISLNNMSRELIGSDKYSTPINNETFIAENDVVLENGLTFETEIENIKSKDLKKLYSDYLEEAKNLHEEITLQFNDMTNHLNYNTLEDMQKSVREKQGYILEHLKSNQ